MNRNIKIIIILVVMAILAIACGSGDKINVSPNEKNSSGTQATIPPEPTNIPQPLWSVYSTKDEMTEVTSYFAISPYVSSTKPMSFPYSDVEAWIGIACNVSEEWVYIGFSTSPNLLNTEIKDSYNDVFTRLKWDDTIETWEFFQKWGDRFLNFYYPGQIIDKIETHDTLLLELNWYGEGNVYFEFPLTGGAEGLKTIRTNCAP